MSYRTANILTVNAELKEITETVIHKLERMTVAEFSGLELTPTVTKEDVENE